MTSGGRQQQGRDLFEVQGIGLFVDRLACLIIGHSYTSVEDILELRPQIVGQFWRRAYVPTI